MSLNLLVVEDDYDLASTVIEYLSLEDMVCDYAADGAAALSLASERQYDLVVLDVAIPRIDGLAVCDALRRKGIDTPVLMLTARDSLGDKLAGFDAGTDDYVVKPVEFKELLARIRALAKRRSGNARRLSFEGLVLDLDRREVVRDGRVVNVTPVGWKLLEVLVRAGPMVVSRQALKDAVWGENPPASNSLKVHLHRLRRDVDHGFAHAMIVTIPGYGVALRGPDECG